ncbi:phosphocholine-specific phospholipase C [Amycolatopsis alkalitolerans]|uniref:phospholipase C n=1 Tax=Amycolatopsis alkalitolerans TaxID=2547244 RepID=A0A5C4M1H9_9PSEU|nr:phospholipase C, phosphocholine-specific [Amycolatopsis alkalitolerans]TNC25749.1 phospholipase C, phosphocholine-specific [Amycolatopsis alkalitolerans]
MNDEPTSPGITRRRLLGSAAAASGLAATATVLPANVRKAIASPMPQRGQLQDIEHVVLLMQENRSFDHYFGTLSGVRGFDDPDALRLPDGRSVFYQPDPGNPDGYLLPYRLNTTNTAAQAIPSTSHAWSVQHSAWNGGKMDNWLPAHLAADGAAKGPYTMGYYTREDIPFQYALADAFTICDAYHCSVLGPTHPNRYMWMTGTVDPNGEFGGPALDNGAAAGTYSWQTYPERLTEAGVSWRIYHQAANVTGWKPISRMKQYSNAAPGSALYENAVAPTPLGQFEYDALNDKLPTVSWIMPPTEYDEHPQRMPAAGAAFVAGIVDALAANPDVWAKTVFILSYDENDGLFDHVLPPTPPAGTADEFVTKTSPTGIPGAGLPVGLGFRVPCIIVSPWTVGGWVCSEVFDHTSQLLFLEKLTGVRETNISAWRRGTVGDLTSAFRFGHGSTRKPDLPETTAAYNLAQYEASQFPLPTAPTSGQQVPHQEKGQRPRVGH